MFIFLALILFPHVMAGTDVKSQVVYGVDDRVDLYESRDPLLLRLADSTLAIFESARVRTDENRLTFLSIPFRKLYHLCNDEKFLDQPVGPYCSAALVGPDLILTSSHCIQTQATCDKISLVFGFSIKKLGILPDSVPLNEVYGCRKILYRTPASSRADFAVIQLDRKVLGHQPLEINRYQNSEKLQSQRIQKDTPLVLIGHPMGLPTKIATGAWVRDETPQGFFVANTDSFSGNSGSPVFNLQTGFIEGVLARGSQDYFFKNTPAGSCLATRVCDDDGCEGEEITKISEALTWIPALELR